MTEVYVLSLEINYEGSQILGVYSTRDLAISGGDEDFKAKHEDCFRLGEWINGEWANFFRKKYGEKSDRCYEINSFTLVESL